MKWLFTTGLKSFRLVYIRLLKVVRKRPFCTKHGSSDGSAFASQSKSRGFWIPLDPMRRASKWKTHHRSVGPDTRRNPGERQNRKFFFSNFGALVLRFRRSCFGARPCTRKLMSTPPMLHGNIFYWICPCRMIPEALPWLPAAIRILKIWEIAMKSTT